MNTKICYTCNQILSIDSFYKHRGHSDGYSSYCKECDRRKCKEHYRKNKKERAKKSKIYREQHKEELAQKVKEYYRLHKNEFIKRNKLSKSRKPEYYRKYAREYRRTRKSKTARYKRERYNSDFEFNIRLKLSRRISMAIRKQFTSKAVSTSELLGCSFQEFRNYFESKFTEGMTWKKFMNGAIHIDHIIPCSAFDLTDLEQQKKCFHYSNCQPLWAKDNILKGDKLNYKAA